MERPEKSTNSLSEYGLSLILNLNLGPHKVKKMGGKYICLYQMKPSEG
jgi:hypothetical protein